MWEHDAKKSYLDKVCSAVRWKQAHETIRRELSDHIDDQAEAFMAEGMSPDEAMEKAVLEMGDAEEVGYGLDASYRPRDVMGIAVPMICLVLIGMICRIWVTHTPVDVKYITAIIIGSVCAFALYNVNLYKFAKWSGVVYIFSLVAVFFAVIYMNIGSERRWLYVNNPVVYYAVCLSPALFAGLLYTQREKGIKGLLLCGIAPAALCLMLHTIPSLTGVMGIVICYLFILSVAIMLGIFGSKKALLFAVLYGGTLLAAVVMLCVLSDYQLARLTIMLHPELEPYGIGWIGSIIREIVKNAKFIGASEYTIAAMGDDVARLGNFLYSIKWDYLLTLILYKYGWLSTITVILVLADFLVIGFKRAFRLGSTLGKLLACGIMASFAVQTAGYIACNLGVFTYAPLPLPFTSHGNTALVINLAMAGMLLSLLRTDGLYTDTPSGKAKRLRIRFEWE
ncbi:MAG: FtsW/RodA/SpoVE family cell cycle protein [Clostridia bacterium]|nr:FtsW/RodA/SpoVE family cell cycle protein [Clostridia bacterium]